MSTTAPEAQASSVPADVVAASPTGVPAVVATPSPASTPVVAENPAPAQETAPTFEQVLDMIPPEKVARMSEAEMNLLLKGDPATIARLTGAKPAPVAAVASEPDKGANTPAAVETPATPVDEHGKPVKRIYLGHLPLEDQRAVVELVYAVKEGGAKNIREAVQRLGYAPSAEVKATAQALVAAEAAAPAPATTPAPAPAPVVTAEQASATVEELKLKLTEHEAEFSAAEAEYDRAGEAKALRAIVRIEREIAEAERANAQRLAALETFASQVEESRLQAEDVYAEKLEMPEFWEALRDARDLAELRGDSIMKKPDWPMRLCEKVDAKLNGKAAAPAAVATPQRPTLPSVPSRPVGAVAAPGGGVEGLSVADAIASIDRLSEAELDALIKETNRLTPDTRLRRAA